VKSNARLVNEWEARFRELAAQGRPPDALRQHSLDESERFWANTVPGPDGHTYWTGGKEFRRNTGVGITPQRWVWKRAHGDISNRVSVFPTCGERHCVTLDHLDAAPLHDRRHYTDDQLIGAGQVAAMRLGRMPGMAWWDAHIKSPNRKTILRRFGSWPRFRRLVGHGSEPCAPSVPLPDDAAVRKSCKSANADERTRTSTAFLGDKSPLGANRRKPPFSRGNDEP
jgi:hypothetical protein